VAGSALVAALAGLAEAGPIFAPNTKPEYVQDFYARVQALNEERAARRGGGERFTNPGPRLITDFINLDEREADITDRDIEVWWSYAMAGLPMERTDATQPDGQSESPNVEDPESGIMGIREDEVENRQNSLFFQLNQVPPPFGFQGAGGQRAWQQIVVDAIQRWDEVTGIQFIFVPVGQDPVPPPEQGEEFENGDAGGEWDGTGRYAAGSGAGGDIRIAMADLDGISAPDGSSGGILAWVYEPASIRVEAGVIGNPEPGIADQGLPADPTTDPLCDMDPMDLSACVPTWGYAGNIILDRQERWNDPGTPNLFGAVIARSIGVALGLNYSCPSNPDEPFALMQLQDMGEPFPPLFFTQPQEDDIRAAQYAFGDGLEVNDVFTDSFEVPFQQAVGTNEFLFAPHLSSPPTVFPRSTQLSIGLSVDKFNGLAASPGNPADPDIDRFRLVLPDTITVADLEVTVEPVGTPFISQEINPGNQVMMTPPSCFGPQTVVDPMQVKDLRIQIQTFDPFVNTLTNIIEENRTALGEPESVVIPVTGGIYYITIDAGPGGLDSTQLYNLTIRVTTEPLDAGEDIADVATAIGAEAFYDLGIFGSAARVAVIDGAHVADQHDTFGGRDIPRVSWPGVNPAVTSAASHPTSVAAIAAGDAVGGFVGLAPDAELASASVATQVFPDGTFTLGKTALYFALFGLTDPSLSSRVGLSGPASVVVSSWSGGGLSRNGDDAISQAYDAAVYMNGANIVVAAGNSGRVEGQSFPNCTLNPLPPQNAPGVNFLGERTVVPPANAFNVLSVGAVVRSESGEFDLVAGFSSRGPIDSNSLGGSGADQANARPGVHLVAPGSGFANTPPDFNQQGLDPCDYDGPTPSLFLNVPGIAPGDDPDGPSDPSYIEPNQGTSIAAGFVAGAIALLQDAAALESPPLSTRPEVMKAVLLTGAVKLTGWRNENGANNEGPDRPQDQRDGGDPEDFVPANPAVRPLDVAQGAGRLDLARSLEIYLTGYPPAFPPQAEFPGPTVDPSETNPLVPTIRRPRENTTEPLRGGDSAGRAAEVDVAPLDAVIATEDQRRAVREGAWRDDDVFVGRPLQTGRDDADLKNPRPPLGPGITTGPQSPLIPPKLPGGGGTTPPGVPGPGNPPPGAPEGDGGKRPVEIEAIFVDPLGWDDAMVDQRNIRVPGVQETQPRGWIDYVINVPLLARRPDPRDPEQELPADQITVSLAWLRTFVLSEVNFASTSDPRIGSIQSLELENLELELYLCDAVGNVVGDDYEGTVAVASSRSVWGNTEHITFTIQEDGIYLIRVRWEATQYDVFNDQPTAEVRYGVAWRVDFSPRPEVARPAGLPDLLSAVRSYGSRIGVEGYELAGDYDRNGRVDFDDVIRVLANWHQD